MRTKPLPPKSDVILSASVVRDWLLAEGVLIRDLGKLLGRLSAMMVEAGVPLERASIVSEVLHAERSAIGFTWQRGREVTQQQLVYGPRGQELYKQSTYRLAHETRAPVELKLALTADDAFGIVKDLKAAGMTHYLCIPIFYSNRSKNGVTFATAAPRGFLPRHIAFIERIVPALAVIMELRATRMTLEEVLRFYVGEEPRRRILAGNVQRGAVQEIQSAILVCDLRRFTELSQRLDAGAIVDLLNRYYDCLVPEIERRRGEVLKFMADGVLAIFRHGSDDRAAVAAQALAAAKAALKRIARANETDGFPEPVEAGIALHLGTAAFGNVGSGIRLDFTVIGRDINVASRIAKLNATLGRPLLMSEAFAAALTRPVEEVGRHELPGIAGKQLILAPAEPRRGRVAPSPTPAPVEPAAVRPRSSSRASGNSAAARSRRP